MKIVKGKNVKAIPTETDKMKELFAENAEYMVEFFDKTIEQYRNGELLNFVVITETDGEDVEEVGLEIFALMHSTPTHLRGLLGDAIVTVRRREWGEEDEDDE